MTDPTLAAQMAADLMLWHARSVTRLEVFNSASEESRPFADREKPALTCTFSVVELPSLIESGQ